MLRRCGVGARRRVGRGTESNAQGPARFGRLARILSWTSLASDPKGDVLQARVPDAKEMSCAIDPKTDLVWFKVNVYEPLPERWFGINVAMDSDAAPDNGMAWWGTNKIKFVASRPRLSRGRPRTSGRATRASPTANRSDAET